ncbi:prepilin-type N-terminal cleavage/methylation domain-containing protein [Haloimpatiens sp. FM7330]|uniref:prepilin-type N-terminal cleavage/methylation domain-containing protein n=1 Tax=Haloimpatiens sp. FM7330 TaxID=3298610 RepID=UPI003645D34D
MKNKKEGFTLIEVVIAVMLIAGTVTLFSKISFTTIKASNTNKQRLEALIIAQNYIENIRFNRDKKIIKDLSSLKEFLEDTGFETSNIKVIKSEKKDGISYNVSIESSESEEGLIEIIVGVKPQDSNDIKIGTKLFVQK